MPNNVAEFILRIVTEGGPEAQKLAISLRTLDQAGQSVAANAMAGATAFKGQADTLGKLTQSAKTTGTSLLGLGGAIGVVNQALSVPLSAAGFFALAQFAAETVRSMGQIADIMGVDTDQASKLAFAIEKTGRSFEVLRMAALYADTALEQARAGSARELHAFATLGIDPAKVKDSYDLILQLTDAYHAQISVNGQVLTQEGKLAEMKVILGRSLRELLPVMEQGRAAIEKEQGLTREQIEQSEKFLRVIHELKNELKFGIGLPIAEMIDGHAKLILVTAAAVSLLAVMTRLQGTAKLIGLGELILNLSQAGGLAAKLGTSLASLGAGAATAGIGALGIAAAAGVVAIADLVYQHIQLTREAKQAAENEKALADQIERAQAAYGPPRRMSEQQMADLTNADKQRELSRWHTEQERLERLHAERWQQLLEASSQEAKNWYTKSIADIRQATNEAIWYQNRLRDYLRTNQPAKPTPATAAVDIPDPKQLEKSWEQVLAVDKKEMELRKALRAQYVLDGALNKREALQLDLDDELRNNRLQQHAAELLQTALKGKVDAYQAIERTAQNQKYQQDLEALQQQGSRLQDLRTQNELLQIQTGTKMRELDQTLTKEDWDRQIALAKSRGNEVLAVELQWRQKLADYIRTHGGTEPPPDLTRQATIEIDTAKFDQRLSAVKAQYEVYRKQIDTLTAETTADPSKRPFNDHQVREYEKAIVDLITKDLPKLQDLYKALADPDLGLSPEKLEKLKAEITDLDLVMAKAKKDLGREGFFGPATADLAKLASTWGNLSEAVGHTAVDAVNKFSTASSQAIYGLISGTETAGQAFREMAAGIVQDIISMVVQWVIAHTLLAALNKAFAVETSATGATAAAGMAAAWAPAATAASIATLGGADAAGLAGFMAAMSAGTAFGVGMGAAGIGAAALAEGGPITGFGGPTGDKIPAWLSDREFIQPAAAHEYYGTDLMEALRNRQIPRDQIRAAMQRRTIDLPSSFSLRPSAFANGGPVGGWASQPAINVGGPNVNVSTPPVLIGNDEIDRFFATAAGQAALRRHQDQSLRRLRRGLDETGRGIRS